MKRFVLLTQVHTKITSSNLQSQGRLDIVLHSIITSLFISHTFRQDTILEIICMGPPLNPRKITIQYHQDATLSKKNLKKTIELALNKCKSTQPLEVHPGVIVEEINVDNYITQLIEDEKNFCAILDSYGTLLKEYSNEISQILHKTHRTYENIIFFLGDHKGISKKMRKNLKKKTHRISLGDNVYFTSQVCTILHYEMDILENEKRIREE
ncbi:MAG: hypothetical protein ACLFPL_02280 [Candidatus Nanoarchaeia archaeon]